jgi:hypothetical protein
LSFFLWFGFRSSALQRKWSLPRHWA